MPGGGGVCARACRAGPQWGQEPRGRWTGVAGQQRLGLGVRSRGWMCILKETGAHRKRSRQGVGLTPLPRNFKPVTRWRGEVGSSAATRGRLSSEEAAARRRPGGRRGSPPLSLRPARAGFTVLEPTLRPHLSATGPAQSLGHDSNSINSR